MENSEKVLLITPPYHAGVVESAGRWPNLALINLAGEARHAGYEPVYYDAMSLFHTMEQIEERFKDEKPNVVGITAITASYPAAVEVLALAKRLNPDVVTVIGGVHPTFLWKDVLEEHGDVVDYCVIGEGELTFPELLDAEFRGKDRAEVLGIAYLEETTPVSTPPRPMMEDLDVIRPAWDLVNWDDYPLYFIEDSRVAILSSSRGCIYSCSFCSQHEFWQGTYRERDPEKFVAELEELATNTGVNVFFIADEYPTRSRERWDRILDLLIEKDLGVHILMETCVRDILRDEDLLWKYKAAGVLFIYMGVEAASPDRLKEFNKNQEFEQSRKAIALIKSHDMITESSLIVGMPDETPESIAELQRLAEIYDADYMHFLFITPWPYAQLYKELEPHIEVFDYSKYNLVEPVVKPLNMTRDELYQIALDCYRNYYMRKVPQWKWGEMSELKRKCLLTGMQSIMERSFLRDELSSLGSIPEHVKKMVESLGVSDEAEV